MPTLNPALSRLTSYPAEALAAKRRALEAAGKTVYDFSVGDPREPTDARIVEAFKAKVPAISQYPSIAGQPALRQACAAWLARRFGIQLDSVGEILPTSGSKEAIFHLPLAFCDPNAQRSCVLFGTPAYPVYERGTLFTGGQPVHVELTAANGYRLEPWILPDALIRTVSIIWINYPHNPTGAVVDLAYLQRLADFCLERDILLCSDECYVDMYLGESRPPSILEVARQGVLAFHSLSKRSGMTGYRSGFVAGDSELIAIYRQARANFGVASSTMVQNAAITAWNDDAHPEQRREVFRAKRDRFVTFFSEKKVAHLPCEATFYLWVQTPPESPGSTTLEDPQRYAERLANAGILVSPAPLFGVNQPYVRLALVPSLTDCEAAIDVWRTLA